MLSTRNIFLWELHFTTSSSRARPFWMACRAIFRIRDYHDRMLAIGGAGAPAISPIL